jgi:crossover junction endodeoxyribonuclease RuvC
VAAVAAARRVLGIDPGSRVTGWGLIDSDGRRSRHLASGCVRVADLPWPERLGGIFRGLREVVDRHQPAEVAVEQVFFARNAASALKLGQARGAALCAVLAAGVQVYEYTPRAVKQAVVGGGGADKAQVEHMVKIILSLQRELAEDEADALAVAVCHAHTLGLTTRGRPVSGGGA